MTTLADVVDLVHGWYPPHTADSWDAVGLVLGDPAQQVRKVMLAVDPSPAVAKEAAEWKADLLVVHHPLLLKPVHGFAATTPKGRTLATLAGANCALLTAHTNADQALGGVSEALAHAVGLEDLTPIVAAPGEPRDKIIVFVPSDAAAPVRAAVAEAGAGALGNYDHCTFTATGQGRFRPLDGADPAIGTIGDIAVVEEDRVEVLAPRKLRRTVLEAMLAAHPYEEPAYDVIELGDPGFTETGTGRIGRLPEPQTLREFAQRVAEALPETAHGTRVGGDPEREVRRVAVCGGAGDFLLPQLSSADIDVYLTSDLRHHPASEFLEHGGPALVDVAHWAAESMWLPVVQKRLDDALGDTVVSRVSTTPTDPWTFRI
ncbi:Nif3-like dinuclear metal center hexameric protein [Nocardioides alcanivorans]|uniref:Nif3-like dinuclear metal center hexameric protein n=1 Tax=Nocardioides alcanivorans TaxID=2897352 RepID=UPI001EFF6F11|nr:Nif3-like dinuclear metal center hexameric protein [Nocardioides alcanivorans]